MTYDIVIENLCKNYGKVHALSGVSFKVPSGSLFGLIGPNGAGKTTLFSLLANFITPSSGTIHILGQSSQHYSSLYSKISVLPQDAILYKNRSILSQLCFISRLLGMSHGEAKRAAQEALELVHLEDKRHAKAGELSHGMSKRLGIAQALLGSPKVVLLDEPIAGLDPALAKSMRDLIVSLKKDRTVIVSSHNLLELQEICDHVAILSKGQLKACGKLDEITGCHNQVYYQLTKNPPLDDFKLSSVIQGCSFNEHSMKLNLIYNHDEIPLAELNSQVFQYLHKMGIGILSVSSGSSLEDSFIKLIEN